MLVNFKILKKLLGLILDLKKNVRLIDYQSYIQFYIIKHLF